MNCGINDGHDGEMLLSPNDDLDCTDELEGGALLLERIDVISHGSSVKKKFLVRLLSALHSAGNLSFRTESYVKNVAKKFDLSVSCTVFPVTALLTFHHESSTSDFTSESYTFGINSGLDCRRLAMLDQLCFDIYRSLLDFGTADIRLKYIEEAPELYPWWVMALAFGASSSSSTMLFFGGNVRDGGWAFVFGLMAFAVWMAAAKLRGLAEIECFLSAFLIAMCSSALDRYVYDNELCLYGQLFGGIVWLLPGIPITFAQLELYSKMIIYGSSRLLYGISQAFQLGFGLAIGYALVGSSDSIPDSFKNGCHEPLSVYWHFLLLPIASISFGILVLAKWDQLPGMVLCAGVGQFVSYILEPALDSERVNPAPLMSAIAVTITARVYAYTFNQRPLVYIISGLVVLVPGGVGVRGVTDMWSGDISNGLSFTAKMLLVGVCLALGVFIALLPRKSWIVRSRRRAATPLAGPDSGAVAQRQLSPSSRSSLRAHSRGGVAGDEVDKDGDKDKDGLVIEASISEPLLTSIGRGSGSELQARLRNRDYSAVLGVDADESLELEGGGGRGGGGGGGGGVGGAQSVWRPGTGTGERAQRALQRQGEIALSFSPPISSSPSLERARMLKTSPRAPPGHIRASAEPIDDDDPI